MDLENYRVVLTNYNNAVLLNNKHKVIEFQEEIERIIELKKETIARFGNDWEIIKMNIDKKFDWIDISVDEDYIRY